MRRCFSDKRQDFLHRFCRIEEDGCNVASLRIEMNQLNRVGETQLSAYLPRVVLEVGLTSSRVIKDEGTEGRLIILINGGVFWFPRRWGDTCQSSTSALFSLFAECPLSLPRVKTRRARPRRKTIMSYDGSASAPRNPSRGPEDLTLDDPGMLGRVE